MLLQRRLGLFRKITLLLALALPAMVQASTVYYVDSVNGLDTNSGTNTYTAWKTIEYTKGQAGVGDSVLFRRGCQWKETMSIYYGENGAAGAPIILGDWGNPSAPNPLFDETPELLSGWQRVGATNVWYAYVTGKPDAVYMDSNTGTAVGYPPASAFQYSWDFATRNLYIYSTSNPSVAYALPGTRTIRYNGIFSQGNWNIIQNITIQGASSTGIALDGNSCVAQNCYIQNSGTGIIAAGRFCRIKNNVVTLPSSAGITSQNGWSDITGNTVDSAGWGITVTNSNNTITANIIHNTSSQGHLLASSSDIVTYNECWDDTPSQNGFYISGANNVVSHNDIHQCLVGLYLNPFADTGSGNNRIFDNRIYANTQEGLLVSAFDNSNNQIAYNLIYANGGDGVAISSPNNTATFMGNSLCSNTVYGNAGCGLHVHSGLVAGNCFVADNIFADNQATYQLNLESPGVLTHINNCYFQVITPGSYPVSYNGVIYSAATLANIEATAVGADPLFVNAGAADFHLQGLSPCVDKGIVIPGLTRDFNNVIVPLGSAPEIGAYEYALAPHLTGLTWTDIPSLAYAQGSLKNPVFQINCSSVQYDFLNRLNVVNLGTAKAGSDLASLWLYYSAAGNSTAATAAGQFGATGNSSWSLTGLSHQANDQSSYFLMANIAANATLGATCQFSLPVNQAQFQISGNFPPTTFTNSYSQVINAVVVVNTEISADLVSNSNFRLVKGQAGAALAKIRLYNFTDHDVALNSLQLLLQTPDGRSLSPEAVFAGLQLRQNTAAVSSLDAPFSQGLLFSFGAPVNLPAQTPLSLELQANVNALPSVKKFRLVIADNQFLNQGKTVAQAIAGKSFPMATSAFSIYDPQLASTFSNYPNPFSPGKGLTKIGYYLPREAEVKLTLWTLDHRLVKNLLNQKQAVGMVEITWDGRNGEGNLVRNGVYLVVLDCNYTAGGHDSLARKIAVAK